jgi:hypothetical protein
VYIGKTELQFSKAPEGTGEEEKERAEETAQARKKISCRLLRISKIRIKPVPTTTSDV